MSPIPRCRRQTGAIQGSRFSCAKIERGRGRETRTTPELAELLSQLDMLHIATASAQGQPHTQFRGGPPGFLRVVEEKTLGFADFGGNRQYITIGNLSENPRAFSLLMDYARQGRLKLWGSARVEENDSALESRLDDPAYPARVERAILFSTHAWDVNGPQHIQERFSQSQIAPVMEKLQARISALEAQLQEGRKAQ